MAQKVGVLRLKTKKGLRNKWKKRFFFLDAEKTVLKYFKHDQALQPMGTINLQDARIEAHSKRNKKFYLTIHEASGQRHKTKTKARHDRDEWVTAAQSAMMDWREAEARKLRVVTLENQVSGWQERLQRVAHRPVVLSVDTLSFEGLDSAPHAHCFSLLGAGKWWDTVEEGIRDVYAAGGAANAERQPEPLQRVIVRLDSNDNPRSVYDKSNAAIIFLVNYVGHQLVHSTSAEIRDLLLTSAWQRQLEMRIQETLASSVHRASDITGSAFNVYLDCGPDTVWSPAMQHYVDTHVTTTLGDTLCRALSAASDVTRSIAALLQDTVHEEAVIIGIGIVITQAVVDSNAPPTLRVHQRNGQPLAPLRRRCLSILKRISSRRAVGIQGFDVLCEALPTELESQLVNSVQQWSLAGVATHVEGQLHELQRSTLLLSQGISVEWSALLATCSELGAHSCAAAVALLHTYPDRIQALAARLQERQQVTAFSASMSKIVVSFTAAAPVVVIDKSVVRDVVQLNRGEGTHCHVAYERMDPLVSEWLETHTDREGDGSGSSEDVDETDSSEGSGEEDVVVEDDPSSSITFVSHDAFAPTLHQNATGKEFVLGAIKDRLHHLCMTDPEASRLISRYPFPAEHVEHTAAAINRAFAPSRVSTKDVVSIIGEGLLKLQRIFAVYDTTVFDDPRQHEGSIAVSHLPHVIAEFGEYKQASTAATESDLVAEIQRYASGDGVISWSVISRVLMEQLLPLDVQKSVQCKRHIVVVGLENTGKTLIVNAIKKRQCDHTYPTIGSKVEHVAHGLLNFGLTELGGSHEQRESWLLYTKHSKSVDALLLCVDGADAPRMPEVQATFKRILIAKHLKRRPVWLIINNCRHPRCMTKEDVKAKLKLEKYCLALKHPYHVTMCHITSPADTASGNEVLQVGLDWLYERLVQTASAASAPDADR